MLFFSFFLTTFISSIEQDKYYYVYFIGSGTELETCQNAATKLSTNKEEFCNTEAHYFYLNCNANDNIELTCQENENNFQSISSNATDVILSIATNPATVDFTNFNTEADIIVTPFDPNRSNNDNTQEQCITKGTLVATGLIYFHFDIPIIFQYFKITFNNDLFQYQNFYPCLVSCELVEGDTKLSLNKLIVDECSNSYIQKNPEIISSIKTIGLNISIDSPTSILKLGETESVYTIGDQQFTIKQSESSEIILFTKSSDFTIHIDDPSPSIVRPIMYYYTGNTDKTVTVHQSGLWTRFLNKTVSLKLEPIKKVTFNLSSIDFKYITITSYLSHYCTNLDYYIGNATELSKCKPSNDTTSTIYGSFTFCEENFEKLVNFDTGYCVFLQLYVGTTDEALDFKQSKSYFEQIGINPIQFSWSSQNECEKPNTTLKLVGDQHVNGTFTINNMNLEVLGGQIDFEMGFLGRSLIPGDESEGSFFADSFATDVCTVSMLPKKKKVGNIMILSEPNYVKQLIITFTNDHYVFTFIDGDDNKQTNVSVLYQTADIVYTMNPSNDILFNVDDHLTAKLRPVGLEIQSSKLKAIGNWASPLEGPLEVYFDKNSYFNYYTYDETINARWFEFIPEIYPPLPPLPTTTPTQTASPTSTPKITDDDDDVIVDETIKENQVESITINDPSSVNDEIKDLFGKSFWEKLKDHVIQLVSDVVNEFNINLEMKENQFLAPSAGSTINVDDGNLNLILPEEEEEGKSVKVVIDTSKEVNLSIKGGGALEIKPKKDDHSLKELKIKTKSELSSSLNIHVIHDDVKSLVFDSLNLHQTKDDHKGPLQIKATKQDKSFIPIVVNHLEAQANTKATLSEINISKYFSVTQSASLTLNNVGFKEADLLFDIRSDSNDFQPLIKGNLFEHPKKFDIKRDKKEKPPKDKNFQLVHGRFDCEKWRDLLNLRDTGFNKKVCSFVNSHFKFSDNDDEGEEQILSVLNEDEKDESKDKKVNIILIAGIAAGCAVVIVIIIVVIVVVVKKKKRIQNASLSNKEGEGP